MITAKWILAREGIEIQPGSGGRHRKKIIKEPSLATLLLQEMRGGIKILRR